MRLVKPVKIRTRARGTPATCAKKRTHSSLALPSTGGAARSSFQASPNRPVIAERAARGCTFTVRRAIPFCGDEIRMIIPHSSACRNILVSQMEATRMKRRLFLRSAGLMAAAPFVAAAQQTGGRGGRGGMTRGSIASGGLQPLNGGKIGNTPAMKITDIKTFLVGAGGRNW